MSDLNCRVKIGTLRKVSPGKGPRTGKGSATGTSTATALRAQQRAAEKVWGESVWTREACFEGSGGPEVSVSGDGEES